MEVEMSEEELLKKHKQERKDLQAKIQSLKKSVTKGDKKKKKEVTEEIARLEQELETKHSSELGSLKPVTEEQIPEDSETADDPEAPNEDNQPVRVSRAGRRRNKKAQEEREREKRIQEQAEKNKEGPRMTEMNAIKEVLAKMGLQLFNIPADGNCLYCAVNHQLVSTGREAYTVPKLRKLTAEFMKENKEEFLPFMYNESDETVSEEYFESYCKEVATTKLWGGQLELRALSNVLKCPIKVIQANGPPTLQGENFEGPELILAYHRHLYRLGEHYNSTIVLKDEEEK
ncbi:deubiquitinase OTUD6B [Tribolium castaneum]|uniref:ubiquitinyl hydrolase 1 n=1 Tax=Tribolium castaneum TaxID=7070 RepID=D6WMI2_TRICA|nr:PREDICTED: OTU domain-containing protein 6B [Tribolium castaneum]EFA04273.1 OTU domain-containing protein 6B-like Protein [Tribolium castaneum]|eukprot:XP_968289.1 PREDICTED: OTU domain-containing protein 6B [Tribolium castaneum]